MCRWPVSHQQLGKIKKEMGKKYLQHVQTDARSSCQDFYVEGLHVERSWREDVDAGDG